MNIVLCVVSVILMIFGITEVIRLLVFWWLKPDTAQAFTVVVIPEHQESCEALVRAAAERMRWLDLKGPCRLVVVNREGSREMDSICRFLSLEYPYLTVVGEQGLADCLLEQNHIERVVS